MRLTSFTDYSLRVLMFLAADPERRATIAEIARTFEISENHLMKVVHLLGRAGLLANVRGKGGGLQLAKAPDAINIGKVVRTTEGRPIPAECFDRERNRCVITPICKLRHVLDEAVKAFYAALDQYTLEDLLRNRHAVAKVLFIDTPRARAAA
jgi:Rrf2 family nitric oxide-sensitive transcriptional repressor